jgi:acetyl-CoA carboxylase biotin carboxyl carrier protein
MEESEIRSYAALMKELDLTGLEITNGENIVRMERAAANAVQPLPQLSGGSALKNTADSGAAHKSVGEEQGEVPVTSEIIGVFYAAPSASAAPFVREGERVKKGQTLCIVEAMKLMNEVTAPADGVVEKVLVTDGQTVEFGTKLFLIRED